MSIIDHVNIDAHICSDCRVSKEIEKLELRTISSVSVWRGEEWSVKCLMAIYCVGWREATWINPLLDKIILPLCIPYNRDEAGKKNFRNHHSKLILAYRTSKNSALLIIWYPAFTE